jgi:hypothetical protein
VPPEQPSFGSSLSSDASSVHVKRTIAMLADASRSRQHDKGLDIVLVLLEAKCDVFAKTLSGQTAYQLAAKPRRHRYVLAVLDDLPWKAYVML